jgi:hypothetical protein
MSTNNEPKLTVKVTPNQTKFYVSVYIDDISVEYAFLANAEEINAWIPEAKARAMASWNLAKSLEQAHN